MLSGEKAGIMRKIFWEVFSLSMDVQAILAEGEAATTGGSLVGTLVTLLPIVLVIVLMYFIILRPQKKL